MYPVNLTTRDRISPLIIKSAANSHLKCHKQEHRWMKLENDTELDVLEGSPTPPVVTADVRGM